METELVHTEASSANLKDRRRRGAHKLSANVQKFLVGFSGFINGYSGIVEIVKVADSQLGGLAWGTLSIFLSIAAHKQEREDEIDCAVLEFSRYFPRLGILKEIYLDERLKLHIVEMYTNIIDFARSASMYYQRRSIGRIISSSNPKAEIAQTIEDIREGLVNLRLDCEVLMQKRVYELSKKVEDLKEQLSRMNTSLERSFRDKNAKLMARIRGHLDLQGGLASDISSYKSLLSNEIFQRSHGPSYPTLMTCDKAEQEPVFNHWLNEADAGILFLSGQNAAWVNQTTLNWLSQAAVLVAEKLKREERELAYIFCQTKSLLAQSEKPLVKSVFAYLAFQLLDRRPMDPQRIESEIEAIIHGDEWKSDDDYDTLQASTKLIKTALQNYHSEETVFLVIDRIDQCLWTYETEKFRQGVSDVLDSLLHVVLAAPCKLKILVVSASTSHSQDLRLSIERRHKHESMRRFVERVNWDQD